MNKILKVMPLIILSLVISVTSCQPLSEPPEETTPAAAEETSPATEETTPATTEETSPATEETTPATEETTPATEETTPATTEETSPEAPEEGPYLDHLAPDFELPTLEGKYVSLSELRGKPVMLNFWATWCPPCREEMPLIQEVYDEWSEKGLVVLGINLQESASTVGKYLQAGGYSYPVLLDITGVSGFMYNVQSIPTTFFIDKDGIIRAVQLGVFRDKDEIEWSLRKIIE